MTLQVWERAEGQAAPSTAAHDPLAKRARRRRRGLWVAVMLIVVTLVAAAAVVGARQAAHRGQPLDPGNPGREGAQAIASVLDAHGVAVTVVRGEQELVAEPSPSADTTVVVTDTGELSDETARRMLQHVRGARRVVLVGPGTFVLSALGLPVEPAAAQAPAGGVAAGCVLPGIAPEDTITRGGPSYRAQGSGTTTCFAVDGSASLVAVQPTGEDPEVVVLGGGALLSNRATTQRDNAGVGLRLLGQGTRLLWYVPSSLDIRSSDATPTSQIPRALGPLLFLALFALVALMLWRGRRFGPLVTEPLPAVVKAIETTQSRGRLYRKSRDTGRAGAVLRSRATERLATYLGLPRGADAEAVAAAAAAATSRAPTDVIGLLAGASPQSEAALVALAHDLSDLEKEVRRA